VDNEAFIRFVRIDKGFYFVEIGRQHTGQRELINVAELATHGEVSAFQKPCAAVRQRLAGRVLPQSFRQLTLADISCAELGEKLRGRHKLFFRIRQNLFWLVGEQASAEV